MAEGGWKYGGRGEQSSPRPPGNLSPPPAGFQWPRTPAQAGGGARGGGPRGIPCFRILLAAGGPTRSDRMTLGSKFLFGTVGSPRSTPPKPGGSVGAVQHSADLGLMALELGWVQSVRVTKETCRAIREAGQSAGVSLSVHAPYYINLNADRGQWPKAPKPFIDPAPPGGAGRRPGPPPPPPPPSYTTPTAEGGGWPKARKRLMDAARYGELA